MTSPAGSELSFLVLDCDILQEPRLSLLEKAVVAYYEQSAECVDVSQTSSACARFLGVSTAEVAEAKKKIRQVRDDIRFEIGGEF